MLSPSSSIGNLPGSGDINENQRVVRIGNAVYLGLPSKYALSNFKIHERPLLATTISIEKSQHIDKAWLGSRIESYKNGDDVFTNDFLELICFSGATKQEVSMSEDTNDLLEKEGVFCVEFCRESIPCGPYLMIEDRLWEIYRLYEDLNSAFVIALHPQMEKSFAELNINHIRARGMVAVPSRLKSQGGEGRPLEGLRVIVKDNYDLKGVKTSLCSFAYRDTYPPRTRTAACVQTLIDAGAVILAKSKLSSYVAPAFEEPVYCIDYPAPWNPRADGYQSPAGSSSGSGVAIATYDWVDITLGSDTSGSGRRPGHWDGAFAIRPSHGYISLEGLPRCFPRFDTPTCFSREIKKLRDFSRVWYGGRLSGTDSSLTKRILYPLDFMPVANGQQQKLIDKFVQDLEDWTGIKHEKISFNEVWDQQPPNDANGTNIATYMKDAARDSYWYDHYHNLDDFRRDHFELFQKYPYISPPVRDQWSKAAKVTLNERNEAMKRLDVYQGWFLATVMQQRHRNTLIIMPIENLSPRYRDEQPPHFVFGDGVSDLMVSPIVGTPELVIPVGHVNYFSKITSREEKLCCAVGIMGPPGSDLELMDLIHKFLVDTGRPAKVDTGAVMFQTESED